MTKQIEKNGVYELEIMAIGAEGEGIAKLNNFSICVPDAMTGDVAQVKILKVKKNIAYGRVVELVKPSPDRIEPVCEVSKKCSGCQLQHMNYDAQLEWKRNRVSNALFGIRGMNELEVLPVLGMETPLNYRNKAQYPIRKVGQEIQIGLCDKCVIQDERYVAIIQKVKQFIETYDITIYNEKTNKGTARHLIIKTAYHTKEVMVCLVINGKGLPEKQAFIESMKEIEGMSSLILNYNRSKTNVVMGHEVEILYGKDFIVDTIGTLKFKSTLLAFAQVNVLQAKVLYDKVLEFAALTGSEIVWDIYSGSGSISLYLSQKAKKVYSVESVEPAVVGARENAELNAIDNIECFVGKAEEVVPSKYKEGIVADVVILDPPRKGCDDTLLETLIHMQPEKIIYVSSDLDTQSRDVGYLCGRGYKVEKVQPIDMAPHTTHIQSVTLLVKDKREQ